MNIVPNYFQTNITTEQSNDALYTPEFENVIRNFCDLTSQSNISLVDLADFVHAFKKSNILSILLKKKVNSNISNPALTCLRNFAESYERNISMQFVSHFLSVAGIRVNLAPSNNGAVNSGLAQITYNNTTPLKVLTRASAETMETHLANDMKEAACVYTVQQIPACVTVKFNVDNNVLDLLANAQLDYCNTVIEGSRRHNIEVAPYIASRMKDA